MINIAQRYVWCAMSPSEIIGLYYFDAVTVSGENYHVILQSFFITQMQRYSHNKYLKQYRAPAHYRTTIRDYLDQKLLNILIDWADLIVWPLKSPDLTPLDFYYRHM